MIVANPSCSSKKNPSYALICCLALFISTCGQAPAHIDDAGTPIDGSTDESEPFEPFNPVRPDKPWNPVEPGRWGAAPIEDDEGAGLGFVYYDRSKTNLEPCWDFAQELIHGNRLPKSVDYKTSESGGIPVFEFTPHDRTRLFTGSASYFAITLRTKWTEIIRTDAGPDDAGGFVERPGDTHVAAGTSTISRRSDIFCLDIVLGDPACADIERPLFYWWGRHTPDPRDPGNEPFSVNKMPFHDAVPEVFHHNREYEKFEFFIDIFKWAVSPHASDESAPRLRNDPQCVLRLSSMPDNQVLSPFRPDNRPAASPEPPDIVNHCIYDKPFNPFTNEDVLPEHGLPNSMIEATDGLDCICANDACDDATCEPLPGLTPRMQLYGPSNSNTNRFQPLEAYCDSAPKRCRNLGIPSQLAAINADFGLRENATLLRELTTPRYRNSTTDNVPWGGTDGSGDRGPWIKARLKAGFDTKFVVVIRNESVSAFHDPSGDPWNIAYCDESHPSATARIIYRDSNGIERETPPLSMSCFLCNHHSVDDDMPPTMLDDLDSDCPALYGGITPTEGVRFKSQDSIPVPLDATGEAFIELTGFIGIRNDGVSPQLHKFNRRFPLYIDGVDENFGELDQEGTYRASVSSQEACWLGATSWAPSAENGMVKIQAIPNAFDNYLDNYLDSDLDSQNLDEQTRATRRNQINHTQGWLLGGDVNRWFKLRIGDESRLYTLAGDVQMRRSVLDWFHYRGSTLHFYQHTDTNGDPAWIKAGEGIATGTVCPAMKPELLENGYPWAMVRSTGQNHENAMAHVVQKTSDQDGYVMIDHCQETGKETTAPVSGFQFSDQVADGDAYIWFFVGRDWGWVARAAVAANGTEIEKKYDLMSKTSLATARYEYDRQREPWGSFIGHWDHEDGIDDLARTVAWDCIEDSNNNGRCDREDIPTTFVNTSPVVVDDLAEVVEATNAGFEDAPENFDVTQLIGREGLLVWHSGCYRCSDLFLSFALKEDVLQPQKYWHFIGLRKQGQNQDLRPTWSRNESRAVPIIWDTMGEFSAVDLRQRNKNTSCRKRTVFKNFVVVYNILEQRGVVMREAEHPWGPYSGIIPLYDNTGNKSGFVDAIEEEIGKRPIAAYGGYTHLDLWGDSICNHEGQPTSTTVRFNASVWVPYKTVLVEAHVRRLSR
jgi:hypothetical protein